MRRLLLSLAFSLLVLAPQVAFAQATPNPSTPASSSGSFLCRPSEPNEDSSGDVYNCVTRIYNYAIAIGAVVAVIFIIAAGYMYFFSGGGTSSVAKAKNYIETSIAGLIILLGGFLVLKLINPNLLIFPNISPEQIAIGDLENTVLNGGFISPGGSGGGGGGAVTPATERGQCTKANLAGCAKWSVDEALAVCNVESRGYNKAKSGTDKCDNLRGPDGDYLSFSYGIMQVSLKSMGAAFPQCAGILDYPEKDALRQPGNCPGGFGTAQNNTPYCKRRKCTAPKGQEKINECVNLLYNVANNVKASCALFSQSCWAPWPDTGKVVTNYKKCPR